nr:hypothetical protein [uncultured Lachnoanaerobaculum sp.]
MQTDSKELIVAMKKYLGQYYKAKLKRKQLEVRLKNFREEMVEAKGINYSPVPGGQSGCTTSKTEDYVVRALEIEDRIMKQQVEVQRAMFAVMEVMDFLPIDSVERSVLEYRHIDCLPWKFIIARMSYSKASCHNYYNAGIDMLLGCDEVQATLQKYIESNK